jgi:hypothetical protein
MDDHKYLIFGAVAAAAVLLILLKKKGAVSNVAQAAGGAVVDAAAGLTAGVVYGVGDAVGVPRTDMTECDKAIQEGRTWDASFACPAGKFLSSVNPFS